MVREDQRDGKQPVCRQHRAGERQQVWRAGQVLEGLVIVLKFMSEGENTGRDELTSWAEDKVNDLLEGVRRHSCSFSM